VNAVFADTFYWIALINPGDRFAQEVQRFDDLLSGGSVYTTEEVLVEVLTFFAADTWLRIRAVETVREILSDPAVHVIPQSHESFLSGFDLYAARPDKGYSLTDCISMQTMRREGLTQVLTNDRHF
jgi:uncharacterized protein